MFGVGISLLIMNLGYFLANQQNKKSLFEPYNHQAIYTVELLEAAEEKAKTVMCKVEVESYSDSAQNVKLTNCAVLYIEKDSASLQLQKGDKLFVDTKFTPPSENLNPNGFNYAEYLARKGIRATAYIPADKWHKYDTRTQFSIISLAEKTRQRLLNIYRDLDLGDNEFAVVAALTLGYKDALDEDIQRNFSRSGAMHILAVSGLHVGVIYIILNFVFGLIFRKNKFISTIFTICALWSYAFITGLPPSVVRAVTMFSLVEVGSAISRKSQIYNTISVSAFFIILLNPNIVFEVGFQLSYMAVVGIVYFQPKIARAIYIKNKYLKYLWDFLSVSLAAQITTLPFALYYFHQFPNYFLITNLIAIPLSSLIIYTAVLCLALSPFPSILFIPGFILKFLLKILNKTVQIVHNLPFAITISYINLLEFIALALFIILIAFYFERRRFKLLITSLSALLIFFASHTYTHVKNINRQELIVYADNRATSINIIEGNNQLVISNDSIQTQRVASNFWGLNKLKKAKFHPLENSHIFSMQKVKIVVLSDDLLARKTTQTPLQTDILIIGNKASQSCREALNCITPKLCIIDSSISPYYAGILKQDCVTKGISYYDTSEKGAFRFDVRQDKFKN